jgi:hypothetical protein
LNGAARPGAEEGHEHFGFMVMLPSTGKAPAVKKGHCSIGRYFSTGRNWFHKPHSPRSDPRSVVLWTLLNHADNIPPSSGRGWVSLNFYVDIIVICLLGTFLLGETGDPGLSLRPAWAKDGS